MKKVILCFLALFICSCTSIDVPVVSTPFRTESKMDMQKFTQTVYNTVENRKGNNRFLGMWTARKINGNTLEACLDVRSHRIIVDIVYKGDHYDIIYKDSTNMNYDAKSNTIHRKYYAWVSRLDSELKKNFYKSK